MMALKDMEVVWPSASRAWDLLNGVKMSDGLHAPQVPQTNTQSSDRPKRMADDAFGPEKVPDYPQRDVYGDRGNTTLDQSNLENQSGVQDLSTRIMAHMLGLDIPGIDPSVPIYPAYQWWPRSSGQVESSTQVTSQPMPSSVPGPGQVGNLDLRAQGTLGAPTENNNIENWTYPALQPTRVPDSYSYDFSQFGP